MFNELLRRMGLRLAKTHKRLKPVLHLAPTSRYLSHGNKYVSMKFASKGPHNIISVVVREVCNVETDEYRDEVLVCPTTTSLGHYN